jgi:hypothetical protein
MILMKLPRVQSGPRLVLNLVNGACLGHFQSKPESRGNVRCYPSLASKSSGDVALTHNLFRRLHDIEPV